MFFPNYNSISNRVMQLKANYQKHKAKVTIRNGYPFALSPVLLNKIFLRGKLVFENRIHSSRNKQTLGSVDHNNYCA